jgi:hypothetical protein
VRKEAPGQGGLLLPCPFFHQAEEIPMSSTLETGWQPQPYSEAEMTADAANFETLRFVTEQQLLLIAQMRAVELQALEEKYQAARAPLEAKLEALAKEQVAAKEASNRLLASVAPQLRGTLAELLRRRIQAEKYRHYLERCLELEWSSLRAEELAKATAQLAELQREEARILAGTPQS